MSASALLPAGADLDESGSRGRLQWHCRRGMHELDLLLQGWMERHYQGASPAERADFARLLELPDPELSRLLLQGGSSQDPALEGLIQRLRGPLVR